MGSFCSICKSCVDKSKDPNTENLHENLIMKENVKMLDREGMPLMLGPTSRKNTIEHEVKGKKTADEVRLTFNHE